MTNINLNDDDDEKKEFFFLSNEHNTVNGTQTERQYVKQKKNRNSLTSHHILNAHGGGCVCVSFNI